MKNDDPQPKTQPSGNRPPPRPPSRTAVGLGPEGDDSDKKHRTTITTIAYGEGKFIRQSGVEVISDVSSDAIPTKYIKPVTEGVREGLDAGVVDGTPIVDIVVHIVARLIRRVRFVRNCV
jgi:translation elongation factor EF-G